MSAAGARSVSEGRERLHECAPKGRCNRGSSERRTSSPSMNNAIGVRLVIDRCAFASHGAGDPWIPGSADVDDSRGGYMAAPCFEGLGIVTRSFAAVRGSAVAPAGWAARKVARGRRAPSSP